jgi:coenzyme PQQ precursor peptide PqqA
LGAGCGSPDRACIGSASNYRQQRVIEVDHCPSSLSAYSLSYVIAAIMPLTKECLMTWKTPKIVEVLVGMEINMYACATGK